MAEVVDRPRELRVATTPDGSHGVRLSVHDVGIGIDPTDLERVLDPFFTTKPDGMGIGLSISRSIIDRHHGRLWAERHEGPGVTFSFTVPADRDGAPTMSAIGAP